MKALLQYGRWMTIAALFGLFSSAVTAQDREQEIQKYVEIFSGKPNATQQQAAEQLEWAGLSDSRIFDAVEKNLLAIYKTVDRQDANYASWLCKALAFSGQEKYRATLQGVEKDGAQRNLRNYASWSLKMLDRYAKWNPIIDNPGNANPAKSADINRVANMVLSGDKDLQNAGAQRIIEQHIDDDWLYDLVQQTVRPELAKDWTEDGDVKAVAYMLKALASSHKQVYRATLEEAAAHAGSVRVRKYAEGYLKTY